MRPFRREGTGRGAVGRYRFSCRAPALSVESALAELGGDLEPGDIILMNDPYLGGTHLNDVTIIYPVFEDGELVFFPAVREHTGPMLAARCRGPCPVRQRKFIKKVFVFPL